ncbi:MAG: hypothetical protein MZV64_31175 [Ignavibacteriales bacterium]|nr:hypothetical protein [Ignavibacteriales bacterium]
MPKWNIPGMKYFLCGGYKSLFEEDGEQAYLYECINYRVFDAFKVKVDYAYQDFRRLKNVQYISWG